MATEGNSGHHRHDHSHAHGGNHAHAPADFGTAFAIGTALSLGFVLVELIYGLLANSMALVADAGHNLGDARVIVGMGCRRARPPRTFPNPYIWPAARDHSGRACECGADAGNGGHHRGRGRAPSGRAGRGRKAGRLWPRPPPVSPSMPQLLFSSYLAASATSICGPRFCT